MIQLSGAGKRFSHKLLFENLNWLITSNERTGLVGGNGTGKSSRWIQDGSYLRVKTVNLGYNLPRSVLTHYHIDNARFYIAASNLFTFTKYTGFDPEINAGLSDVGIDRGAYPQARTYSVGLDIKF